MDQSSVGRYPGASLPASYFKVGSSSFSEFLAATSPDLLPGRQVTGALGGAASAGAMPSVVGPSVVGPSVVGPSVVGPSVVGPSVVGPSVVGPSVVGPSVVGSVVAGPVVAGPVVAPHGTTIVAATFRGGVLIAGDRRATVGNFIAQRDIEKVFVVDDYSAVGIAGAAGVAVELVRLFAVELQHYEKIEGVSLTLDGKANKLAGMVRGNLQAAMQGLAVVPLFVGYDVDATDPGQAGRIVSYDVVGGRYDETVGYHSVGSGSLFARSSLKKLHDPMMDAEAAVRVAMEALYDAADDDSATGGPDPVRQIYPVVVTVTAADGAVRLSDEHAGQVADTVVEARKRKYGG